jgi:histidinol-phosphate aminotransferase
MTNLNRRSLLAGSFAAAAVMASGGLAAAAEIRLRPEPGIARLSANENPYGPSPKALAAAKRAAEHGAYYPGPIQRDLVAMIAEQNQLSSENVVLSSGSNEALCAAMAAYGGHGKILAPELTYSPHLRYAEKIGVEIVRVPLAEDMSIDLAAMAARAEQGDISLIYVCNPNNPTGMLIPGETLRPFCQRISKQAVVLVDEAYNELTDRPAESTMVDLVRAGDKVIVMRTFSKIFALAGLRIGYTMAAPALAATVRNHVMAWLNVVGMAAAIASYQDQAFIEFSRQKIAEGRELINNTFARHNVPYLRSETNFVYADIGRDATEFADRMLERKVQIRRAYPPYDNFSRVSTGKLEDLETFARVFHEVYTGAA